MEGQICGHFMYGYCKFKEHCVKKHVKGECKALSFCTLKVCLKRHPKVCMGFSMENFCKLGAQCAYKHLTNDSTQVQKQLGTSDIEESQNNLKIQLLEDELKVLKSQILQIGCLIRKLINKVDLLTSSQVSTNPVVKAPPENEGGNHKKKEKTKKNVTEQLKFKCDQCDCSFKRENTCQKHKNTNHGQIHEKLSTSSQVSKNPVVKEPPENEGKNHKKKEETKKNIIKQLKFKCDQCDCSFKREVTLKKHKNTNHGQIQEKLG